MLSKFLDLIIVQDALEVATAADAERIGIAAFLSPRLGEEPTIARGWAVRRTGFAQVVERVRTLIAEGKLDPDPAGAASALAGQLVKALDAPEGMVWAAHVAATQPFARPPRLILLWMGLVTMPEGQEPRIAVAVESFPPPA